jgi:hypothetical protein
MLKVTHNPFKLSVVMLSVLMMSVVMLNVTVLSVVAPYATILRLCSNPIAKNGKNFYKTPYIVSFHVMP